jgi:hypothetical protein
MAMKVINAFVTGSVHTRSMPPKLRLTPDPGWPPALGLGLRGTERLVGGGRPGQTAFAEPATKGGSDDEQ